MTDFLDKLKKNVEDSYSSIRHNAINLKDLAGEYSKIAKLKIEIVQAKNQRERIFNQLGKSIFPFVSENNWDGLKDIESLQIHVDEIKNLSNRIELLGHAIDDILKKETENINLLEQQRLQEEITILEKQIEERLSDVKEVKNAILDDKK